MKKRELDSTVHFINCQILCRSTPGEPHQMKCKCVGSNKTRMGETLAADIVATIMDKHGNDIKKVNNYRNRKQFEILLPLVVILILLITTTVIFNPFYHVYWPINSLFL